MTMTSWPYVAQDTTDVEYGRLYREMAGTDGIVGSFGDGGLAVTADSSGMNVKMAAGSAILRGYMFYSTAIETVPVLASGGGNRVDLLVLELNLSAPLVANRILPKVLSNGTTTPPALTQDPTGTYQIALATIAVDGGVTSIAANKVTDVRTWVDQKVGQWTTSRRPVTPRKYKLGFNETTGGWEYWNGTTWVALNAVNLTSSSVTGILPIEKGGSGHSTWQDARESWEIYVQSTQPSYLEGRVWIKVP